MVRISNQRPNRRSIGPETVYECRRRYLRDRISYPMRCREHPNALRRYVTCMRRAINNADTSTGRAIAGLAVGQLTMIVPLYISEV